MQPTPPTLLDRVRNAHDQTAWEQFVRLYTPLLMDLARRLGLQDADTADLVQDVFVALVQAMPHFQYDANRSFRAWLGTLALNRWRDRVRKRAAVPVADHDPVWNGLISVDPNEAFEESEYRATLLSRALAIVRPEFSPAAWEMFQIAALEGVAPAEAARRLGASANAVYLARARVVRRLREVLTGLIE
jgi:RNA polymerase sigma-70 factor (ECF subfamily)